MKSSLTKHLLGSVLALSLVACGDNLKEKSNAELQDLSVNSELKPEKQQAAFKEIMRRADEGDTDAMESLMALSEKTDKYEAQLSDFHDKVLSEQHNLIANKIEANMQYPEEAPAEPITTMVRVEINPDGSVKVAQTARSSGDPNFDNAATAAVNKASPFKIIDPVYDEVSTLFLNIDSQQDGESAPASDSEKADRAEKMDETEKADSAEKTEEKMEEKPADNQTPAEEGKEAEKADNT